jgi:carboxymethylenebutenolidase
MFLAITLTVASAQTKPDAPSIPIPPDNANAPQALKDSPRHGEWVDIALPESQTKLKTWVVYPEREGKAPVVIVIHEIFGLTDWARAVADQLAAEGFIALAPDLLSGKGPDGGGTDSFEGDAVREAIRSLTTDEVDARLDAVRGYAIALPAATDRCATVGFCWGGTQSFNYAVHQPKLNAAVVFYGTGPHVEDVIENIQCPVLGCYAIDDARVTMTVEPTARTMTALKKKFTHLRYEGAGHGFMRQQDGREGANLKAAKQSWAATIEFLKKNLEQATP